MPINTFFIIVAFYLILDIYTYFGLKSLLKNQRVQSVFSLIYLGISCWILYAFYVMYGTIKGRCQPDKGSPRAKKPLTACTLPLDSFLG